MRAIASTLAAVVFAGSLSGVASLVESDAAGATGTPIQLLIPQSTAFSYLGHSCGGIQEQAAATGFDAVSGFPQGNVYLQTRCGGSGRGGGYTSTTYSAWVAVTWDFTAAVVSVAVEAAPSSLDPSLSVTDTNGNLLANSINAVNVTPASCAVTNTTYCNYGAWLTLSPGFVPAPRVTSVSTSAGPSSGGANVAITGDGFTAASAVSFGGLPASSFMVISDTSITAVSPPLPAGTVDITVASAGGTSGTAALDQFTAVAAPIVTSISPTSGPMAGGTQVTILGSNLSSATGVSFGGTPAGFSVLSDGEIQATSPATDGGGEVAVSVSSIGGSSSPGSLDRFYYNAPGAPTLTSISPAVGGAGGRSKVVITGQNLLGTTSVDFGGVSALSFSVNATGTALSAVTPAAETSGSYSVDVNVTSATGTGTLFSAFSYVAPVVTSISPGSGPGGGGVKVTIVGKYLSGATAVSFGGIPATSSITVNAAGTSAVVMAPAGGSGPVDVSVTSSAGSSPVVPGDVFTYLAPSITAVTPSSGSGGGGTKVVLSGSNMRGTTSVSFGGSSAKIIAVSNTTITVLTPSGGGSVMVSATSSAGTGSLASAFVYLSPTVTAITPSSGPPLGGTKVVLNGLNFRGATGVMFGLVPATSFVVASATSIVAYSPPGAGVVDVTVQNAAGSSVLVPADRFSY